MKPSIRVRIVQAEWDNLAAILGTVFLLPAVFFLLPAFTKPHWVETQFSVELPKAGTPAALLGELRIRIAAMKDGAGRPQPQYSLAGQPVLGLAALHAALEHEARENDPANIEVVLDPSDDAPMAWVIGVLECLDELEFRRVDFAK